VPHRSRRPFLLVLAAGSIALAGVAVYAGATRAWLTADDFQLLGQGQEYDPVRAFAISGRSHFYRPIVETWFAGATGVCGRSVECLHALNIAAHVVVSLLVAGFAGALARRRAVGVIAGLLFAVQPAPVEAVVWIAAITEVLATLFFVAAAWSFIHARRTGRRLWLVWSAGASALALLSHESSVTVIVVLALVAAMPDGGERNAGDGWAWPDVRPLLPAAAMVAAYLAVAWLVNSRNYLIAEGVYAAGPHVAGNLVSALVSLAVASRGWAGAVLVCAVWTWAVVFGAPRVRFFAIWTVVTLAPALPFESGLASRYLYLPAVGFAAVLAEWLVAAGDRLARVRRPVAGRIAWLLIAVIVVGRFASFAVRNARDADGSAPFLAYATDITARFPALAPGAHLVVPPPPDAVQPIYVQPLLRWVFDDPTLTVEIGPR
jgi:hypothetical protein